VFNAYLKKKKNVIIKTFLTLKKYFFGKNKLECLSIEEPNFIKLLGVNLFSLLTKLDNCKKVSECIEKVWH
jgi:hypothetical protein